MRAYLCTLFMCASLSCSAPEPNATSPKPSVSRQSSSLGLALQQSLARVDSAKAAAQRGSEPAHIFALGRHRAAIGVVERVAERSIPAALWRAQQHLALGVYSAELRASYPPHEGAQSKKKRKGRLEHGALTLYYQKSGQRIDLEVFDDRGQMRPEALATFSKSLYSPGTHPTLGENVWIAHHPRLLTMLYYTAHHYGKPIEIISAFRIPKKGSGSNHGKGRAVDLRVPGVKRRALLSYLDVSFEAAGIGWYPNSTFIHLDARARPYRWTDRSRPGQRQRNRKRKAGRLPKPGTDPTVPTVHIGPR